MNASPNGSYLMRLDLSKMPCLMKFGALRTPPLKKLTRRVGRTRKFGGIAEGQSNRVLKQNGLTGRWEVPTDAQAARATRMFNDLGIKNIEVKVVKQ
jgi:hypothetical protein